MAPLFEPARHEALAAPPWSDAAARAAITRIATAAADALDPRGRLAHPLDDGAPDARYLDLYQGSGGVLWALHRLGEAGDFDAGGIDFAAALADLPERNRAALAGGLHGTASFLLGDAGLLLLRWRLAGGDDADAQALFGVVEGNLHNPVREALWGNPGTLLAAIHLAEAAGAERWAALVRRGAEAIVDDMEPEPGTGRWVWVQDLYGRRGVLLGAGHGFAGNLYALLRAAPWLPADRLAGVLERSLATLESSALRSADGALANWPPALDAGVDRKRLVQDCHGAPGIVCRLADGVPRTPAWDALLRAAGELTWRAGPLAKGPSLCHGTAGSAWAFLKLWRRFGEPAWRERAQAFAMHAVAQVEAARARHGRARDALWTGDLGVACLLSACLHGDARLPTFDVF